MFASYSAARFWLSLAASGICIATDFPLIGPEGSRCEINEDDKEICKPYSKGALGRCNRGAPSWGLWGEEAADVDRGGLSPLTSSLIACRFSLGSTFRAKRVNQAREILSSWER